MSSIHNKNYINVTYKGKKSSYPEKFCKHLFDKKFIKFYNEQHCKARSKMSGILFVCGVWVLRRIVYIYIYI